MARSRLHPIALFVSVAAGALLLAGCTTTPSAAPAANVLAAHGLDGLDGRELIERLDTLPVAERPNDLLASVRPDAVVVSDPDGFETSVPLPADEFYVSIAPYATRTHDCYFHSLTTCLGELRDEPIRVRVTDPANGAVLVDRTTRTYDNGFIGLWLPKGIDADLLVESGGRSGRTTIGTGADDPTCVTTLALV
ncbi:CueP family metal-binding protein [Rhodococcus sp. NPDC054953]